MAESKISNAAYFWAILYPENMVDNWQNEIDKLLQIPYCYCIHDKDLLKEKKEERKKHIHLIVAFPNTTTLNHAFNVINRLSAPNKCAIPNNRIEACVNIRYCYNYLIHDTDDCRKSRKHLYDLSERVEGLNFDIGTYEQISMRDKLLMVEDIDDLVIKECICNYADLKIRIKEVFDLRYWDIFHSYSSHYNRLCNGMYQKMIKFNKE